MRFPASSSQQRLWFLDQLAPGEPTYNMAFAMWLDGPLEASGAPQPMQAAARSLTARPHSLQMMIAISSLPAPHWNPMRKAPQSRPSTKIGDDRSFISTNFPPPILRR